jgi:hypothetical protein
VIILCTWKRDFTDETEVSSQLTLSLSKRRLFWVDHPNEKSPLQGFSLFRSQSNPPVYSEED